jgi:CHAT domain-containing protein
MAKSILLSCFFVFSFYLNLNLNAQDKATYEFFIRFSEYYKSGDLINARSALTSVVNSKDPSKEYLIAAYNNLGLVNYRMGNFKESLESYNLAEEQIGSSENSNELADIYINKSTVFLIQKSYLTAREYLEKGISIYNKVKLKDKSIQQRISTAYMNLGIVCYTIKDYKTAFDYLIKSYDLKRSFDLKEKALLYLNMAKTFAATNNPIMADNYYQKSINKFTKEFGVGHNRLAEVYFDYGLFLDSQNEYNEAMITYRKALIICRKCYGEKHNLTSLSYKHIADLYIKQVFVDSALVYFQKSLISVVKDFNDMYIYSNPGIDSAILNIRLLDDLKGKARALEMLSNQQVSIESKIVSTKKSLETIELALTLIDRIRINYLTQESKMYLAENEKETYLFAVHIAGNLYKLTNDKSYVLSMFNTAQKSKAAVLRNDLMENALVYSLGIPDSIRIKQLWLSENIPAYEYLVIEENKKSKPDIKKISLWKDAIFEMKRENEKTEDFINKTYPEFYNLLRKTNPSTLEEIQKHLTNDEMVVDYLLSTNYSEGKRKMYIFLISKERLDFQETDIDSLMAGNTDIIRHHSVFFGSNHERSESFTSFTSALYYMYTTLIKPVEYLIKVKRLIIIPDEETGFLPFDAFLKSKPAPGKKDFENLEYLVNDYSFSFGYSTSTIIGSGKKIRFSNRIVAFTPYYNYEKGTSLPGARNETSAIFKLFNGTEYSGKNASKRNFMEALKSPAIFHLAMHSLSDTSNSRFSYLLFGQNEDKMNNEKLYNYEISLNKIYSPMVVLSTCNSGSGKMYEGEGIMSLARGFILAGASSVVRTKWDINDESGSLIIKNFYYYLSKGISKDESMRLAKLDFIKSNPPYYSNPYFWAGYEVLGDNSQITTKNKFLYPAIIFLGLVIFWILYYFRKRRIILARSL